MPVCTPTLRRLAQIALLAGCALAIGLSPALAQEEQAAPGRGIRVIDGDTLQIDGHLVQLYGIDAPELGQLCDRGGDLWECGRESALYLQMLVSFEGPPVECSPWGEERADDGGSEVVVGVCQVGPKGVALTMVQNGYAVALPDSFPEYKEAEEQARQATLGIWRGDFVLPWQWREGKGAEERASDWVRRCTIKGVPGPAGEPVYYVPTDEAYPEVAVDPDGDGRMFCSDEEARAAGWTRPRE